MDRSHSSLPIAPHFCMFVFILLKVNEGVTLNFPPYGGMVESEYTADLKSVACKSVRVQISLPSPLGLNPITNFLFFLFLDATCGGQV